MQFSFGSIQQSFSIVTRVSPPLPSFRPVLDHLLQFYPFFVILFFFTTGLRTHVTLFSVSKFRSIIDRFFFAVRKCVPITYLLQKVMQLASIKSWLPLTRQYVVVTVSSGLRAGPCVKGRTHKDTYIIIIIHWFPSDGVSYLHVPCRKAASVSYTSTVAFIN